ncbi:MAG TPA: hypothetical protein VKY74_22325 [Chloroflexia bacterium]|nr:hypothetical protein [Chloroflexia bacterium]
MFDEDDDTQPEEGITTEDEEESDSGEPDTEVIEPRKRPTVSRPVSDPRPAG